MSTNIRKAWLVRDGIRVSYHRKIMIFAGGIPLKLDGKMVSAIGISGDFGDQAPPRSNPADKADLSEEN
jgi:uncharacterized protein GlcG (DUF336 family)